jgi:hypothetical protein
MTRNFIIAFIMILLSCNGLHQPGEKEIREAVINLYEKRNHADGGGGWYVKDVQVLKTWKGSDERHYNADVSIKGVHTSPALAERRPDEDFADTITMKLIWRGGGWIGDDE